MKLFFQTCAILGILFLAPCTTVTSKDASLPENTEFIRWTLEQVASTNKKGTALIEKWRKVTDDAEANAPALRKNRSDPAFSEAVETWKKLRRRTVELVQQTREFLRKEPSIDRLRFTIGKEDETSWGKQESWKLKTGTTKKVLIEIRNSTGSAVAVNLTGGSNNGFYLWPWQQKLPPETSFFSLLKIRAYTPGKVNSFISLEVTSTLGKKAHSEITLEGEFTAPAAEGEAHQHLETEPPLLAPAAWAHKKRSEWYAGLLFHFQEPHFNLQDTIQTLHARNIMLCHIGSNGGKNGFGSYPVSLSETCAGIPSIAVKGTALLHPFWGGIAVLNPLVLETSVLHSPALPGRTDWPDLVTQCERIHRAGGTVIGIPSGSGEEANLELCLAALLGELDALYLTEELLPLWYDLLNCGIQLPPAGSASYRSAEPAQAVAYVHLTENFTYERYLRNLRAGKVFIGATVFFDFTVEGHLPGATLHCAENDSVRIRASGRSIEDNEPVSVEVIANGTSIKKGKNLDFTWSPPESSWIAVRTRGGHTGAVYVLRAGEKIFTIRAAESLLKKLETLRQFTSGKAFLREAGEKELAASLKRGEKYLTTRINAPMTPDPYERKRRLMVETQLENRDIHDKQVIQAMRSVPRHIYVPEAQRSRSYGDYPLPIGYGQTISQPYIVAYMTQALNLEGDEKVLEIGTGSGYQAAVLSELVEEVYTMEIIEPLARRAEKLFREQDIRNIHVRFGNGYKGWPEEAPFDAIIVTAAPAQVPEALIKQLAPGGRIIVPVGTYSQQLRLIRKSSDGRISQKSLLPVLFVPMTDSLREK